MDLDGRKRDLGVYGQDKKDLQAYERKMGEDYVLTLDSHNRCLICVLKEI